MLYLEANDEEQTTVNDLIVPIAASDDDNDPLGLTNTWSLN